MQLVVTLPDLNQFSTASTVRWALFDAGGAPLREGEGALASTPLAERIVAAVPATRIVFIETALPPVGDAKRDALLRYAIEDKLTIDPATVHAVVLGRAQSGDTGPPQYIVAAIDRNWLRAALDWLASAGRAPQIVVTQTEAIDVNAGEWRVVLDAAHATAKRADGFAYSFDLDASGAPPFALSLALREAAAQARAPTALALSGEGELAALAAGWQAALGLPVRVVQTAGTVARPKTTPSANLLQGEFAPAGNRSEWLTALRPALAILALIVLAQWLFTTADWWRLERKRKAVQAANEQIFRAAFPQAQTIVDAPLQMQRNVEALRRERGLEAADVARSNLARLADLAARMPGFRIRTVDVGIESATMQGDFDGTALPAAWNDAVTQAGGRLETAPTGKDKTQTATVRLGARR